MNHAVIVTGDRNADLLTWRGVLKDVLTGDPWFGAYAVLIHGGARGIDRHAAKIGGMHGWSVLPLPISRERWDEMGYRAGPLRNKAMLDILLTLQSCEYDVRVLAFHDDIHGTSRGTKDMVTQAQRAGVPVTLYHSDGSTESIQLAMAMEAS